jgi:hypothetical protein
MIRSILIGLLFALVLTACLKDPQPASSPELISSSSYAESISSSSYDYYDYSSSDHSEPHIISPTEIKDFLVSISENDIWVNGEVYLFDDKIWDINFLVLNSYGEEVDAYVAANWSLLDVDDADLPNRINLATDMDAEIVGDLAEGSYTLKIMVTPLIAEDDILATATFKIEAPTGTLVELSAALIVGDHASEFGAAVDMDAWEVYTSYGREAVSAELDWGLQDLGTGEFQLTSPIDFTTPNWGENVAVFFATTGVDFAAIKTQEEINTIVAAALEGDGATEIEVSDGDVVLAISSVGKLFLLNIKVISDDEIEVTTYVAAE